MDKGSKEGGTREEGGIGVKIEGKRRKRCRGSEVGEVKWGRGGRGVDGVVLGPSETVCLMV
jgi:hypothetical protein